MDFDWMQWPAMVTTLAAAWLVASESKWRRHAGFWVFLASNVLWVVWSIPGHAYAVTGLQIGLAAMNLRGLRKTEPAKAARTV